jgi:hypothetical protein
MTDNRFDDQIVQHRLSPEQLELARRRYQERLDRGDPYEVGRLMSVPYAELPGWESGFFTPGVHGRVDDEEPLSAAERFRRHYLQEWPREPEEPAG